MSIKQNVKMSIQNINDRRIVKAKRNNELKKFELLERKNIYENINLSLAQKQNIDELYIKYYGERIPYIWHRYYTAFTGNFDVNFFLELLYIPEFEYYMNSYRDYARTYEDKNVLPLLANAVGIKTPQNIVSNTKGIYRDSEWHYISEEEMKWYLNQSGKVFCKPSVDSGSGKGCFIADLRDGRDCITGFPVSKILEHLGMDFTIQECIVCHESIRRIYSESVNTFRIITYRWGDEIKHLPSIMRIGRGGSCLDNAHAGGIFIAIEEDGTLHQKAFTEFNESFDTHPDSGVVFAGYKIKLFPHVLHAAEIMHQTIPQVGSINWDFTIDSKGDPLLIEANINGGSIWLPQIAHGKGAFGEETPEILRWLKRMNVTKPSLRNPFKII